MSRLGKIPVVIPSGVEVTFVGGMLTVKGPKGTLARPVTDAVTVTIADGAVTLAPKVGAENAPALWGTYAAHLRNMVEGVTNGFKKELEIEGVGYRAAAQGRKITLSVGFSHPVELEAPEGIEIAVEKNLITITGSDKDAVGQFAANVREVKKPEPYKGKGIHYVGEYIIRKQGKKAV
ncbi:50S ribosomal protein L6 [Candidatus Parcubacteria bacterium]|uniref:Large ribosomal subunit protein uL6 n=1 Tax=Candidatus Kaiserbacteria bacterium CG10_big_fil_rev_8_21_14_0_10_47_16 TaxID=1974608 RepID=A0A2H0UDX8_9BACT|nr:50S ribosomal protein L6 [Candidatus Parcubacteria bacterium]PIR84587.1 MAG: 50S ribosomal protein L6 [Candidatus Kaiserbacteria bacterium CG10_big_fil_rev_8_21_14_0_10_47_16]